MIHLITNQNIEIFYFEESKCKVGDNLVLFLRASIFVVDGRDSVQGRHQKTAFQFQLYIESIIITKVLKYFCKTRMLDRKK